MTSLPKLNRSELRAIERAVDRFESERDLFDRFARSLALHLGDDPKLAPYIHFLKYRVKECDHLRGKLQRKALAAKARGEKPEIRADNLYSLVSDLAGVRILHLHTEQVGDIVRIIGDVLDEHRYTLVEGPTAMCWDNEYARLFEGFGIKTDSRDSMYTSVHYVIEANQRTKIRAELQVRTLMEEVWGEVSHRIDYPSQSLSRACRDQLKVLARMTSGCTRLVDSIFRSHAEHSA
jgi:ppGpp synthetase/RelA/SpoT-type nucleotidyltranferase